MELGRAVNCPWWERTLLRSARKAPSLMAGGQSRGMQLLEHGLSAEAFALCAYAKSTANSLRQHRGDEAGTVVFKTQCRAPVGCLSAWQDWAQCSKES